MQYKVLVSIQDDDSVETSIKFTGKADEERQLLVELLSAAVKAVNENLDINELQASTADWLQAIGASLKSHAIEMVLDVWDGINPLYECMQLPINVEKLIGSKPEEEQEKVKAALQAATATLVNVDLLLFVEKETNNEQFAAQFEVGERVNYGVSPATVVDSVYRLNSWWYWLAAAGCTDAVVCVKEDQLRLMNIATAKTTSSHF